MSNTENTDSTETAPEKVPGVPFPNLEPLPQGPGNGYKTLAADPCWRYDDKLPGGGRGADSHYDTLDAHTIAGMGPQVRSVSAGHALLFLWSTNAFLAEAHRVAENWGFDVKTTITWVKVKDAPESLPHEREEPVEVAQKLGMGHYVRNTTEQLLVCQKGSLTTDRNDVRSVVFAEPTEHSAKPDKFYRLIEELSPGPRLELFARGSRDGWRTWGKEAEQ